MYANPILFPQVTNRESWVPVIELRDDDTGDPIDLSGLTSIQLEVRIIGRSVGHWSTPMAPWYDDPPEAYPILTASLGNGIAILDVGYFQVVFPETKMRTLKAGTYRVGCVASDGSDQGTRQLFVAQLPVIDGGVTY
jgi:hypothetical protein